MSCPDCFQGSVHDHAKAKGKEELVHGFRTYVTGPATAKSAILFLPDAFGIQFINNKILADRYAEGTNSKVLIPDIIPGGSMPVSMLALGDVMMKPAGFNIFGQLKRLWALIRSAAMIIPFMIRAHPAKAYSNIVRYARAMRADLPEGGKLGVCGFCWGGYGSTRLCSEPVTEGSSQPLIGAQFNAHPGFIKAPQMIVDAIKAFKVPYSLAVAPKDFMLNDKKALETEAALRKQVGSPEENNYEIVIHEGCKHGFAVRADPLNNKVEAQGYEDAAQQAINWFNRFLN